MAGAVYAFDGYELDTARYELRSAAGPIPIEPRALDVLHHLVVHHDRVVTKEELLDSVWGDRFVSEAALTTALRTVRLAIGDSGKEQRLIRTIVRRGYQFVGTIAEVAEAPPAPAAEQADGIPLPPRLAVSSGLGFAGREHERSLLRDAWKAAAEDGLQVVLVSGEAGIGKTTLCSAVAAAAHDDGAVVLYGRCDEELSIPYQPWREVLDALAQHLPDVLDGLDGALAPLTGGEGSADLDSDSARFALNSAAVQALAGASTRGRPAVVVLDDLHWADGQTLALVRHLVERARDTPALVVCTFRDTDVDASHPLAGLLAATHREPGTTRVALRGLDDEELLGLLEAGAGHEMDEDGLALRDALVSETAGNPFFVTEILRHLTDTGAIVRHDGRWTVPTDLQTRGLPVSVREVVGQRVERLGPGTRRALEAASMIGRDFDLDLLAELLDEDPARTFEHIVPAIDNALVVDAGARFAFTHAIVAHTLHAELSATARAFGHRATAEALERRLDDDAGERTGEIAHHWVHATGLQDPTKVAAWAQRAGDHALGHLAPDAAIDWYQQALELLPGDGSTRRCEILVGLGTARRQAGEPTYRETLLEAGRMAIDLGRDDLLVRAALANNRGEASGFGATDDERIEILRRAVAAQPAGPDGALLQAILAVEVHGASAEHAEAAASRALALARETGDDRVLVRVARLAESALRTPGALSRREQILQEGIAAAARTDDPQLRGMLSISHHEIALQRGDRDAMDREKDLRHRFSERSPEPYVRWTDAQTHATHLFLDGDLAGAEAAADVAFELGAATGQPEAAYGWAGQIFEIRRAQDRLAEVAESIEQVVADDPGLQVFRAALALVWCELGREDDARALTDALDVSPGSAPQFWSTTLVLWAEVCHALALPEPAAELLPLLDDWREQVASTGATTEGAIAHGLGLALVTLGRDDEAAEAFELALAVNRRLRAPLFVARTQLARAELVARTDPDRARALTAEAATTAEQHGFARIGRKADEVLELAG